MLHIIQYEECQHTGELGWLAKGSPETFIRGHGRLIAHDCLEHFKHTDNGVQDELLALGALLFVRYKSGLIYSDIVKTLAYELEEALRSLEDRNLTLDQLKVKSIPDENDIESIVEQAVQMLKASLPYLERQLLCKVYGWVLTGYVKARRRYNGSWLTAHDMFKQIDEYFNRLSRLDLFEGMEVKMYVNFTKGKVTFKPCKELKQRIKQNDY